MNIQELVTSLRALLNKSQQQLKQTINTTMVQTYWNVGRIIVQGEQKGSERASYGKQVVSQLAEILTDEFGKGFDARNLRNMRAFYQAFPIWNTVCTKLSWSARALYINLSLG